MPIRDWLERQKGQSGLCRNANKVPAVRLRAFSGPSQRKDDRYLRQPSISGGNEKATIISRRLGANYLGIVFGSRARWHHGAAANTELELCDKPGSFPRSPWSLARFSRSSFEKPEAATTDFHLSNKLIQAAQYGLRKRSRTQASKQASSKPRYLVARCMKFECKAN